MAVVARIAKGCDLDYMWKNADTRAAQEYYLSAAEAGEPPGRWWGPGAEALRFQRMQVVERRRTDGRETGQWREAELVAALPRARRRDRQPGRPASGGGDDPPLRSAGRDRKSVV